MITRCFNDINGMTEISPELYMIFTKPQKLYKNFTKPSKNLQELYTFVTTVLPFLYKTASGAPSVPPAEAERNLLNLWNPCRNPPTGGAALLPQGARRQKRSKKSYLFLTLLWTFDEFSAIMEKMSRNHRGFLAFAGTPLQDVRDFGMATIAKQSYKQSYTDNVELSIFNCGHEYCQPGHTWGPGVRDHYLIHLVVAGKGVYQVNGSSYNLQEGDLFLAKPSQLITYAADDTDPWEYYWVGFNGACANKLVQQTPFSDVSPVHHCKDPQLTRESIYNIYLARGPEPQCEALMTGYLYLFMAQLMKEARESMPNAPSSSSQYVLAAIKYIQFNYSHDISVDDIAKAVGVSRSHLYRVFMSNVGQSPIDYLTGYRISEACSLLKNTGLSIAEIAVSVGFFDQFYFSRVFKKVKGVPPSKYLSALEKDPQL